MKKIISVLMCILLISNINISVNAQQSNNEFYETIIDNSVVYTSDDTNLPSSGNYYFGVTSNGNVWYVSMSKAIPMIMNKVIGVTLKPEVLINFISDYLEFGLINSAFKPVYNGNTKIGIAFEDLTGKTLLGSSENNQTNMVIPSSESNNVYNYYIEWYEDGGYSLPDWISIETRANSFYLNKLDNTSVYKQAASNFLSSSDYTTCAMTYNSNNLTYSCEGKCVTENLDELFFIATNTYQFDYYNLTQEHNTINFTDMLLSSSKIETQMYLNTNLTTTIKSHRVRLNTDGTYTVVEDTSNTDRYYYFGGYTRVPCCDIPYITVYRSRDIVNQFVNHTYAPVSFNSEQYYNYNTENDNSTVTSISETDNSTTNNETIYNESAESFEEYYTENNYHIDNSVTINNTTTIIQNIYGEDDNGGDDNGGGSGGGGDDSDGSLLDRLLNAIIDFFKNIGKIIGALLAGLFELLNSILDAIANINNSFAGIKNFLSSIFSWFPADIVTLMVLGLGLALLASFITWFKK